MEPRASQMPSFGLGYHKPEDSVQRLGLTRPTSSHTGVLRIHARQGCVCPLKVLLCCPSEHFTLGLVVFRACSVGVGSTLWGLWCSIVDKGLFEIGIK